MTARPLTDRRARRSLISRAGTVVALAAVLLVAAFSFGPTITHKLEGKTAATGVAELRDIEQLRAEFNQDAGSTRLVLIFSPT